MAQQGPNGQKNTYRDIDRNKLTAFILHREGGPPLAVIDFRDDRNGDPEIGPKRLIWRRRHSVSSSGGRVIVHLAGWQRKIAGRNVQSILYVREDNGAVVMGGQWLEDAPLMHSIVPLEFEQDLTE